MSYQNEIPKARVNIQLDVVTNGSKRKKELPLKLLVLGDFSVGGANIAVSDRKRISVSRDNFDQVIEKVSPHLHFGAENMISSKSNTLQIDIPIKSLRSFHPDEVVKQVPALRQLVSMRNLLKDLKSNVLDNTTLRHRLTEILQAKKGQRKLSKQLSGLIQNEGEGECL